VSRPTFASAELGIGFACRKGLSKRPLAHWKVQDRPPKWARAVLKLGASSDDFLCGTKPGLGNSPGSLVS